MRIGKTKSKQLRNLLESNQLEFLLEAHNGISAKLVEEAGFKGISIGQSVISIFRRSFSKHLGEYLWGIT